MNAEGLLAHRAFAQLTLSGTDYNSNLVVSAEDKLGFALVNSGMGNQLLAFSLDTAAVVGMLPAPQAGESLGMHESNGQRTLVFIRGLSTLVAVNATNPAQMQETAAVMLPRNVEFSGLPLTGIAFSADGRYVFVGNQFINFSAVDLTTMPVVDSFGDNLRFGRVEIFEGQGTRLLAIGTSSSGTVNAPSKLPLVNATNPADLLLVNEVETGEGLGYHRSDFTFSNDGKRIFLVTSTMLRAFAVPSLILIWKNQISDTSENLAHQLETFGQPEKIIGAWGVFTALLGVYPDRTNRVSNFDADGNSDLAVFRPDTGTWYIRNSGNGSFSSVTFGLGTDLLVPGDYDGDGKTDAAIFRPSEGTWYILQSLDGFRAQNFGLGTARPVPADYDGDGKTDLAVFRPQEATWYIHQQSLDGLLLTRQFGSAADVRVPGDYDGDGKSDIAVFRLQGGIWTILQSSADGFIRSQPFGIDNDLPVPGDYDADGKTDLAVFRKTDNTWYILRSRAGFTSRQFGTRRDRAVPADYDGDGKTDIAIFRLSESTWYILQSSNQFLKIEQFGANEDVLVASVPLAQ